MDGRRPSELIVISGVSTEVADLIGTELPEIDLIMSGSMREQLVRLWADFLSSSTYARIGDAPAFPGLDRYDLATHTRHVVRNSLALADSLKEFWAVDYERDILIAAALAHDASKLVEYSGPEGAKTELGKALLHAQLAGVRCMDVGLPFKVAHMVTLHPFTPPHVHVKPQYVEFIILTWADLAAADPLFFLEGKATHLEFAKRFFQLE
jgi:hypothetical protein